VNINTGTNVTAFNRRTLSYRCCRKMCVKVQFMPFNFVNYRKRPTSFMSWLRWRKSQHWCWVHRQSVLLWNDPCGWFLYCIK